MVNDEVIFCTRVGICGFGLSIQTTSNASLHVGCGILCICAAAMLSVYGIRCGILNEGDPGASMFYS